ncbi:MAG: hypothetical protein WCO42_05430 [bacterium]
MPYPTIIFAGFLACLLSLTAMAAPVEIKDKDYALMLPDDFTEVPITNRPTGGGTARLFVKHDSTNDATPFWFSIRKMPGDTSPETLSLWRQEARETNVAEQYSEHFGNLDVDIFDAEVKTNDITIRQRQVQLPTERDLFLLDLHSPQAQTNEMDAVMRQIIKSIADQNAAAQRPEVEGWRDAIICLAMVAMIIVVAIARR